MIVAGDAVECWSCNDIGQLGYGASNIYPTPQNVLGLPFIANNATIGRQKQAGTSANQTSGADAPTSTAAFDITALYAGATDLVVSTAGATRIRVMTDGS